MEKIVPLALVLILCIFGYRAYSKKQTALWVTLGFERMIEDTESYKTLSDGMGHEPARRIQLIRDSIQAINRENERLAQLVTNQRNELKLLRDSLNDLNANINAYVDVKLREINDRFEEFKKTELGKQLEENSRLTQENRNKDEQILLLQQQLLEKEAQIDSLNQVIIDKNAQILALTTKIQELQEYIARIHAKMPQALKAIQDISNELRKVHAQLSESNVFNRRRRMEEVRAGIERISTMYQQLNNAFETQFFDVAINELATLDDRLKP